MKDSDTPLISASLVLKLVSETSGSGSVLGVGSSMNSSNPSSKVEAGISSLTPAVFAPAWADPVSLLIPSLICP